MTSSNEGDVEMTNEIDVVIEIFLTEARSAIENGGTWSPLVHIVHPGGKESIRITRMNADPREEGRIASPISSKMKELNAIAAFIITNNSIADKTWDNSVHRTMQTLFPD